MKSITLIFPHQLFKAHPALQKNNTVVLAEEWLFFKQYNFHKQKLVLHRASMQFYKDWLTENNYEVWYINANELHADVRQLIPWLAERKTNEIHFADVTDDWLFRRLNSSAKKSNIKLVSYKTPYFINDIKAVNDFFNEKGKYFQTDFYIDQRKRRNILLDANKKPEGGHWSHDAANRKKIPKNEKLPFYNFPKKNIYVQAARDYVEKHFHKNYGSNDIPFANGMFYEGNYPCTFGEAKAWLKDFLLNRFNKFGVYEDAIVQDENILYHSALSPLLNIGLLEPQEVIDETLLTAKKNSIPLNSVEGFVRQIIGWREFIHIVYERESRKQRNCNYWGFKRKIPESFWKGTTGVHPIDTVIKKVLKSGYTHHIERLMVLGNFMLLCEFDPDEVYRWFMELFVDAYDWVMVPNTYGMTQFADGGLMMTKPYISGSNYLMKMSNFPKGEWQGIWDGLFWRFMHVHRNFFIKNPRLAMLVRSFDKMDKHKQELCLQTAEKFLKSLDSGA